ncbi:MAG: hypothetical protein IIX59_03850 [Alistipes sp.]|nr:hypothetical protein [Alistipes sp.]
MANIANIISDLSKVGANPVKSNNSLKWCNGNREDKYMYQAIIIPF